MVFTLTRTCTYELVKLMTSSPNVEGLCKRGRLCPPTRGQMVSFGSWP